MTIELWGGHEATLNRVGDHYFDQTRRSGHEGRFSDLEAFAKLGIRALRYPVLWERVAPQKPDVRDFSWTDERLTEIRRLGMRPILGLIHHGSGPVYTNLLAPDFPCLLADYAQAVAERYPWVTDWTPVNEPLTTARFSCLYGLWYPHLRDETCCWLALLNEIDAVRLSMRAVRKINPQATLVQTEDLSVCHAPLSLTAQAQFENERRWLTWDLLLGRVVCGHPLWDRLSRFGLTERLQIIADDPCPPDIIGANYYLTSERFLDDRLELYPAIACAADGPGKFVNIEAVRILQDGLLGLENLIPQIWHRYQLPIAITECHNGSTRDEQLRWFFETWRTAETLKKAGVSLKAVTAWALLGSYDWNNLVVADRGFYEPGVYDVSAGTLRPTALARLLKALAAGEDPDEFCLASPGWWHRRDRVLYEQPEDIVKLGARRSRVQPGPRQRRPILIVGQTGTLGQALARACSARDLAFILSGRETLSLESNEAIQAAFLRYQPCAVINAAGWVRIDDAEIHRDRCLSVNVHGAQSLAGACTRAGIPFVAFSSDQVFDGLKGSAYTESDEPNPLNTYGFSKAEAERLIFDTCERALVIRTAAFFSFFDGYNFAVAALRALRSTHGEFKASFDEFVSPTYVPDLANAVLDLLIDDERGLWHVANQGRISWADFATLLAERAGLDQSRIQRMSRHAMNYRAHRPADAALTSNRGLLIPSLDDAVSRFLEGARAMPLTS